MVIYIVDSAISEVFLVTMGWINLFMIKWTWSLGLTQEEKLSVKKELNKFTKPI